MDLSLLFTGPSVHGVLGVSPSCLSLFGALSALFLAKLSSGKYIAWGSARDGADLLDVQVRLDGEGAD